MNAVVYTKITQEYRLITAVGTIAVLASVSAAAPVPGYFDGCGVLVQG